MKKKIIGFVAALLFLFNSFGSLRAVAETDVDPELAHYRLQYESLLKDYFELQERYKQLETEVFQPHYDINGDGIVTIADAVALMRYISEMEV